MSNTNAKFDEKEKELLGQLLLMSGRETEDLTLVPERNAGPIKGDIVDLSKIQSSSAKRELANRILALLGIGRINDDFFDVVFEKVNFSKIEDVKSGIHRFRCLCLLECGDIKEGFERFSKDGPRLRKAWNASFSPKPLLPLSLEIKRLEAHELFPLGYLAYDRVPKVNEAREKLKGLLDEAISEEVQDHESLEKLATEKGVRNLYDLLVEAGIPEADAVYLYPLMAFPLMEKTGKKMKYVEILAMARNSCKTIDRKRFEEIQRIGNQNTAAYLSAQNIDVYIATSMREPLDFAMNWNFVERLQNHSELTHLHLTFFDPTQAYLPDRIQKGLLECMMVERGSVTIYNAQEAETFGKDAEAAISLAHGKTVIVYVPRLFVIEDMSKESMAKEEVYTKMNSVYRDIDESALTEYEGFLDALQRKDYFRKEKAALLRAPEMGKRDAIGEIIDDKFPDVLKQLEIREIRGELLNKGYSGVPQSQDDLLNFCLTRIKNLEIRGLLFREIHPLTFQISPVDGIPRGVLVTRSINDTARLLRALFEGSLEYEIREIKNNIVLIDAITHSPIRACPRNSTIRNQLSELRDRKPRLL